MQTSEPFELLGGAQTLLGVLATLNVLCIFIGNRQKLYDKNESQEFSTFNFDDTEISDNNFLFSFLLIAIKSYQTKLETIINNIQSCLNIFQNSSHYKTVLQATASSTVPTELKHQSQRLIFEAQFVSPIGISNVVPFFKAATQICLSKLQVIAPFFCLLLTILIFIVDQVGYLFDNDHKLLIYAVNLSTLISSSYWFCLWITFIVSEPNNLDSCRVRSHFECKGKATTILACFIIFYLSIINIIPYITQTTYICAAFNTYSLTLVFVCLGGLMIYKNSELTYCSYGYVLKHLFIIISFVGCITVINIIHLNSNFAVDFDIMANKYYMRLFLCLFLTLNGVVLPFLCPYIKCKIEFHRTRDKARQKSQEVIETIKRQETKFKDLADQIKDA